MLRIPSMVIAENIIAPPTIVAIPGTSPTPIQTHIGAKTGSTMASKPTCAAGTEHYQCEANASLEDT